MRPRQQQLLDQTLPRLRFNPVHAAAPAAAFASPIARLALEVGFGSGEHAAALTAARPALGLIACEVFANGLCSLLSRLVPPDADPAGTDLPGNLRLWDDDARLLIRALPDSCLDLLVLMFPDPWPKPRHAKRRFVHPAQIPMLARVLKPGGEWRIASDDPSYQDWVNQVMSDQTYFAPAAPQHSRPDAWPATRYEAKALRAGRTPLYWLFVRNASRPGGAALEQP